MTSLSGKNDVQRCRPRATVHLACLCLLTLLASDACAHSPVLARVLAPQNPAEAWNVIRLSTGNVERLLRENRLAEIPDRAALCGPALRALTRWSLAPGGPGESTAARAVRTSADLGSLVQASQVGDHPSLENSLTAFRTALAALAIAYDPKVTGVAIYSCPMHPDFASTDPTVPCGKCGMATVPRRIPYSFVYVPPGESTLRLAASTTTPLLAGYEEHVTAKLTRADGTPVPPSDLLVTHIPPIHLLVIDQTLRDYHHEHPVPTGTPGEYTFSFTPVRDGSYRVFADVVPADTAVQEYPFCDLSGGILSTSVPTFSPDHPDALVSGLRFRLSFDPPAGATPCAARVCSLRLDVARANSSPVLTLTPVMNAFAHLVGFYEDGRTVIHLHPTGPDITQSDARGGPTLNFQFYPPKAGKLRLFCQVQIDGAMIFAPFDLAVAP